MPEKVPRKLRSIKKTTTIEFEIELNVWKGLPKREGGEVQEYSHRQSCRAILDWPTCCCHRSPGHVPAHSVPRWPEIDALRLQTVRKSVDHRAERR